MSHSLSTGTWATEGETRGGSGLGDVSHCSQQMFPPQRESKHRVPAGGAAGGGLAAWSTSWIFNKKHKANISLKQPAL